MGEVRAISLSAEFAKLEFLPDRRPDTNAAGWFSELAAYRDGTIFIVHYAGNGEWDAIPAEMRSYSSSRAKRLSCF